MHSYKCIVFFKLLVRYLLYRGLYNMVILWKFLKWHTHKPKFRHTTHAHVTEVAYIHTMHAHTVVSKNARASVCDAAL